eukprot:Lithocolla_globosa_v1_NODE_641_length_3531_cov_128.763809.p1 type:complete len:350 gc:universal NODE_641_length_3531_cov_128.763809:3259-2210(-)
MGCGLCTGTPKEPLTLGCGHHFCRLCLSEKIVNQQPPNPHCPVCKEDFEQHSLFHFRWPLLPKENCPVCASPPKSKQRRSWIASHLRDAHPGVRLPPSLEERHDIAGCRRCFRYYAGRAGANAHEAKNNCTNIGTEKQTPNRPPQPADSCTSSESVPRNTFRRIPRETEALFTDLVRPILQRYQIASCAANQTAMTEALDAFLSVPRKHLRKPRGGNGQLKGSRATANLTHHLASHNLDKPTTRPNPRMPDDVWQDMPATDHRDEEEEEESSADENEEHSQEDNNSPDRADRRAVRRAVAYAQDGHLKRAVQAVLRSGVVDPSPEIIEKLRLLHPESYPLHCRQMHQSL